MNTRPSARTMVAKALSILPRSDLDLLARAVGTTGGPEKFTRLDLEYAIAKAEKRMELRQMIVLLIDKTIREEEAA